jgi:hypothetical protein
MHNNTHMFDTEYIFHPTIIDNIKENIGDMFPDAEYVGVIHESYHSAVLYIAFKTEEDLVAFTLKYGHIYG